VCATVLYFSEKEKEKRKEILVVKFKSYPRLSMLLHLNPEIV
jgi:hypothetical protein